MYTVSRRQIQDIKTGKNLFHFVYSIRQEDKNTCLATFAFSSTNLNFQYRYVFTGKFRTFYGFGLLLRITKLRKTFFDRQDFEIITADLRDRELLKLFQAIS